jgi:hypothetical protein
MDPASVTEDPRFALLGEDNDIVVDGLVKVVNVVEVDVEVVV